MRGDGGGGVALVLWSFFPWIMAYGEMTGYVRLRGCLGSLAHSRVSRRYAAIFVESTRRGGGRRAAMHPGASRVRTRDQVSHKVSRRLSPETCCFAFSICGGGCRGICSVRGESHEVRRWRCSRRLVTFLVTFMQCRSFSRESRSRPTC